MSILLSLLGWTKLPPWVIEILAVVLVGVGVWLYSQHVSSKLIEAGRSAQRLEDQKALDQLRQKTAAEQKVIQAKADQAHEDYEKEHADLTTYQLAHPIVSAVQLCQQPARSGRPDLQEGSAAPGRASNSATAARVLQPVPSPNIAGTSDRLRLLDAVGAICDQLSGQVRQFQHR